MLRWRHPRLNHKPSLPPPRHSPPPYNRFLLSSFNRKEPARWAQYGDLKKHKEKRDHPPLTHCWLLRLITPGAVCREEEVTANGTELTLVWLISIECDSENAHQPKTSRKCSVPAQKATRGGARKTSRELGVVTGAPVVILDDEATLKPYEKPKTGKCLCLWICSVFSIPTLDCLFPGFFTGEKKGFLCRRPAPYPNWEIRKRWLRDYIHWPSKSHMPPSEASCLRFCELRKAPEGGCPVVERRHFPTTVFLSLDLNLGTPTPLIGTNS